jgi:HK97 family phage major capsid protein
VNRLAEIDGRLAEIRTELLELAETDLDEDQAARFEALETENNELETEREPLAERAAFIERIRGAQAAGGSRSTEPGGTDIHVRTNQGPFDNLDAVRSGMVPASDLRSRALDAIEQAPDYVEDAHREHATSLVERNDRHGRIARHMLLTGSEAYTRAFEQVLSGAQPYHLPQDESEAMRAAMSLTDGNGGFMVPFHLDPTLILTNAGSTNPIRQMARVDRITGDNWHGITSAGVTAEWLAEAAEAADASPTFARPEIKPEKAAAYLQGSFEVSQDTGIAAQVGMLLADAKDNLEAVAFATGSGTGQPTGVVTAVAAVPASVVQTASVGAYEDGDVYVLKGAIPARHRRAAQWLSSESIQLLTRQFATGSGPTHAFWADLGMDTPSQLLGRSIHEASEMATTIAAGNNILLLGDFSRYLIVDRIGMTVQFEPLVKGANQRPTGEVGWFAHWRVGGGVLDANAFRLLRVRAA